MANILKIISDKYQKTNTIVEQMSLVVAVIAIAALVINITNKNNNPIDSLTDNSSVNFACEMTNEADVIKLNKSVLLTNNALTLINFDTEVQNTGLTKNEIPAVYQPTSIKLKDLEPCLGNDDEILVVDVNGNKRAYSKRMLNFHIVINDTIDNNQILVFYSPLSNYYEVFSRELRDELYQFGVSGLLYKNTDLLFDTRTESLWSPLNGKALVGNMIGATLTEVPFYISNFGDVIRNNPEIDSISFKTGYIRDYNDDPFLAYAQDDSEIVAKIINFTDDLTNKTQVAGFLLDKQPYALPYPETREDISKSFSLEGKDFTAEFSKGLLKSLRENSGNDVNYDSMYWFVWYDYQPKTRIVEVNY